MTVYICPCGQVYRNFWREARVLPLEQRHWREEYRHFWRSPLWRYLDHVYARAAEAKRSQVDDAQSRRGSSKVGWSRKEEVQASPVQVRDHRSWLRPLWAAHHIMSASSFVHPLSSATMTEVINLEDVELETTESEVINSETATEVEEAEVEEVMAMWFPAAISFFPASLAA